MYQYIYIHTHTFNTFKMALKKQPIVLCPFKKKTFIDLSILVLHGICKYGNNTALSLANYFFVKFHSFVAV